MKLSVAMIVKNEEAVLEKCLESFKDDTLDLVIVDTGSTDKTVEIAKRYTKSVHTDFKWCDDFAKARNYAISRCVGNWILTIDADNILEPGGIKKIKETICKHHTKICLNVTLRSAGGSQVHKQPLVYKNTQAVQWIGAVHNHLSHNATIDSGAVIRYTYSAAHKNDPDRSLRILKKEVIKNPKKPREIFYLSREYEYRADWVSCLHWCNEYLKFAYWPPEIADAHLRKAKCLWNLQRGEEARDACLQAIKHNTHFKEAVLFMAHISSPLNRETWLFMAEFATNVNVLFVRGREEKDAAYYEKLNDTEPRYTHLYREVGRIVGPRTMLDIGCGQGKLREHIWRYDGFDMVKNPYRIANIYTHDYGDYDVYVLLEVLEHLLKDIQILERIPKGKEVVFSVPSFDAPSHVRMFTKSIIQWRYQHLLKFKEVTRFNFDPKDRKWKKDHPITPDYILLCTATRV